MPLRPLSDLCTHIAVFYDDSGYYVGQKKIKYRDEVFVYKQRAYNFVPRYTPYFKFSTLLKKYKFYHYNVNSPEAINLVCEEPLIRADVYNGVIENKLIKDLTDATKKGFLDFLTPKVIVGGLIAIAVGYYFMSGGTLA